MVAIKLDGGFSGFSWFNSNTLIIPASEKSNTLTVDAEGYAIVTNATAVTLGNTGPWTVTHNGTIFSQNGDGLVLEAGGASASKITIGQTGVISGTTGGLVLGSTATLVNKGCIVGGVDGLYMDGKNNTVTNSGFIDGGVVIRGEGTQKITNSGQINGGVSDISNATIVSLTNSGSISGDIKLDAGSLDTVTNSGTMGLLEVFSVGAVKLSNSSTGYISKFYTSSGNLTVTNAGEIGEAWFSNGTDNVTNTGKMGGGAGGILHFFGGNDIFKNSSLFDLPQIDMGEGDDQFTGGNGREFVIDDKGSDKYSLGGGNDQYTVVALTGDGTDTVDGGAGIDTYNAALAGVGVNINLDTVAHNFSPHAPGLIIAANTGLQGVDKDIVKNFEVAIGSDFDDRIAGSAAANTLIGRDGADILFGYAGNDELSGGAGTDSLIGGAGKDRLSGGLNGDHFIFEKASDSTQTARDVILEFENNIDKIDLVAIDANTKNGSATNDAFVYIGSNGSLFTGVAGQLRSYWSPDGWVFEGDTNGDKKADFAFEVHSDPTHTIDWVNGNDLLL